MIQALLVALWHGFSKSAWGYATAYQYCGILASSWIYGIIYGNPTQGLIIGSAIQSIYMGLVAPGGNSPSDTGLATAIAVPIGLTTGLDVDTCLTLAVPVGLLGTVVQQLIYTIKGYNARMVDKCAAAGDTRGVTLWAFWLATVFTLLLYGPIVFVGVYFGTELVQKVLEFLPAWLTTGLSIAGGILPSLGFALTIKVIGKPTYIPFFIMGFYLTKFLGLGTMAVAVFAVCAALMIAFLSMENK